MLRNLFKRSAAWGTQFKNRLHNDLFFSARVNMTLLLFFIGVVAMLIFGAITDHSIRKQIYDIEQNSHTVDQTINNISWLLWLGRLVRLSFVIIVIYFFTNIPLKALRQTDAQQKRFIANVAHELRTPMAVMKTTSDVALKRSSSLSREAAVQVISSNLEELERLSKIMNFFLDLSNARSQLHLEKQTVDLVCITRDVVARLQVQAQAGGVHLSHTLPDNISVEGQPTALEEMLVNLIKNAIEHTPAGGQVSVQLNATSRRRLELLVSDTGTGISPQDLPNIFEPFYRGEKMSSLDQRSGTGLGLCIVKDIVQLHNGRITVQSVVGKGTVFRIELPKKLK